MIEVLKLYFPNTQLKIISQSNTVPSAMSPSLEMVFDREFPPEKRDRLSDLEDMTYSRLTLKGGIQTGLEVVLAQVDLEQGTHIIRLPDGVKQEHRNNEDIYE